MNEYEGHWITTFTGKKFHYLDSQFEEIDIRDIAHALALTCRFGGHCRVFYSVAEHSVRVAAAVPRELRLSALLHDAHEAYLHDVLRPIKEDIAGYKEIANRIQLAINTKYKILYSPVIKEADDILLATEARDLGLNTEDWVELPTPQNDRIIPWSPQDAEKRFLAYYLTNKDSCGRIQVGGLND